jgi:GNAT superfamily N-acetyltransferase
METIVKLITDDNEKQQYIPKDKKLHGRSIFDNKISDNTIKKECWAAFIKNTFVGCIVGAIEYWGANYDDYEKHILQHLDVTEHCNGRFYACFVAEDYRKKGIGKLLFSKMEEYFKKNNCNFIIGISDDCWDCDSEKKKFLRSIGFINITRSYVMDERLRDPLNTDMCFTVMVKYIGG